MCDGGATRTKRKAVIHDDKLWRDGVVPYTYHSKCSNTLKVMGTLRKTHDTQVGQNTQLMNTLIVIG